ncbi:hypothetical protein ABK040_012172 [Willaertia magna]
MIKELQSKCNKLQEEKEKLESQLKDKEWDSDTKIRDLERCNRKLQNELGKLQDTNFSLEYILQEKKELIESLEKELSIEKLSHENVIFEKEDMMNLTQELRCCSVCRETLPLDCFVRIPTCRHYIHRQCLFLNLNAALKDFSLMPLRCSENGCSTTLDACLLDELGLFTSNKDFSKYSAWTLSQRFEDLIECPNPKCGILVQADNNLRLTVCPHCHQEFCTKCKVTIAAHTKEGNVLYTCEEFQKLPKEQRDPSIRELLQVVKKENWAVCPKCGNGVEKKFGCNHVECICGEGFCYLCNRGGIKTNKEIEQHFNENHPLFEGKDVEY